MSIQAINSYVNDLITANRDQPAEQITTYFSLMEAAASEMLSKLSKAQRLIGLEAIDAKLLNQAEKEVIRKAVDFIIKESDDLAKDLNLLEATGILNLENTLDISPYHLRYNIEPIFKRASILHRETLGWWQTFVLRNKTPDFFIEQFTNASTWKASTLSDGLETAR